MQRSSSTGFDLASLKINNGIKNIEEFSLNFFDILKRDKVALCQKTTT